MTRAGRVDAVTGVAPGVDRAGGGARSERPLPRQTTATTMYCEVEMFLRLTHVDAARSGVRLLLVFLVIAFLATSAFSAPDEAALGKAEGYPLCPASLRPETRCLIGLVSRFDELFPARTVARGATARPLGRAAVEPSIRYRYQSRGSGLDDYLSRNRTTGLLILKGDTILAERYQYDRTPAHRMNSYSMAKTIVAMLVGIAQAEGKIRSLDDPAERYGG
jgi:CubicO group peptidase (beta-lactamase class C family)